MSESSTPLLKSVHTVQDGLESHRAKSGSPSPWEDITDISVLVSDISRFSSPQTVKDFRFVVGGFLKKDLRQKTPQDIYNILYDEFEPHDSSAGERTVTATVFRKMFVCAGFCDNLRTETDTDVNNMHRLNNLDRFCVSESFSNQESVFQQLDYRKDLLEIGRKITENRILEKIVGMFKENQRGTHPESIKTPIDLFTRLLKKNVLKPDDPSTIKILKDKVDDVLSDLPGPGAENAVQPTTGMQYIERMRGSPTKTDINFQGRLTVSEDGTNDSTVPKTQSVFTGKTKCSMISVLLLLFIFGAALFAFGIYCIPLSFAQSRAQNMSIYRNNTILAARQKLSSAFTESVNFVFMLQSRSNPEICYYDCTGVSPRTLPTSIDVFRNSASVQQHPYTKQRRLLRFSDSDDVEYASIFMLGGSTFNFSVTGLDHPIELFILKRTIDLNLFYRFFTGSDNSSFRNFNLNESNNYKVNFFVPEAEPESYYCGALVLPPEKENVTFQYIIEGFRNTYDLTSTNLNKQCISVLNEATTCPPPMDNSYLCYNLQLPRSYVLKSMCVFVSEMDYNTLTSTQIQTFSTLDNPLFAAPITFGLIISVIFVTVFIIFLFVWGYRRLKCV